MTSKEWKTYKLSDFIDFKNGKKRPINNGQIPVFGGNGILSYTDEYNYENCIIIGRVGIYCGNVFYSLEKCWVSDNAIMAKNKHNTNIKFIYYLLKFLKLNARSIGTGQPLLTQEILNNIEILLPPLETQEKIARVLSSLDDKIELNNKINQNLEQQAQAIFDKYVKSPCNHIKNGTIGDYCNVKSGFAFKSSWWKDAGVKVIKIKTIDNESINFAECSFVDKEKISIAEDFIVQGGDLLIAMTGATIGKFAIVPKIDEVLLVNQRVGKFFLGTHPIKKLPFLYCTLKQQDIINDIINKGQGSAQPNISSTDILNTSCYILENAELEKFNLTCEPIFEKIITNKYENEKLTQLRDTLLPKLMNGEIDVDKVEV